MRRVHVAHLESRPLAGEATRAERRDAPLVRDLGERVVLVHELGELARAEELLDHGGDGLRVDQLLGHQGVGVREAQALLHRSLHAHQPDPELVLRHLADAADAPVAQVVDVVDRALAVLDVDEHLQHVDDVGARKRPRALDLLTAHPAVELHPADRRQVVAVRGEEQVVEQALRRVLRGRLARAHHPIDLDQGLDLAAGRVDPQRVRHVRTAVEVVRVDRLHRLHAEAPQGLERLLGDLVVRVDDHLTGLAVDDVPGDHAPHEIAVGQVEHVDPDLLHGLDVPGGHPAARLDHHLAVRRLDVEAEGLAAQALGDQPPAHAGLRDLVAVGVEERGQDRLGAEAERPQEDRRRQLPPPVDAHEDRVLGVELEIEPGPAIGDHPRREQQLPRRVGLALVVLEEHARRAVQLRDDHALRAVHDERAVVRHERDLAHVDFLLLDALDDLLVAPGLLVVDHQPQLDPQRGRVGLPADLALLDVEDRLTEVVAHVLQRRAARVALDREHGLEGRLQPLVTPLVGRCVRLQEAPVRIRLDRQEVRNLQDARALPEVLADSLLLGEGVAHESSSERYAGDSPPALGSRPSAPGAGAPRHGRENAKRPVAGATDLPGVDNGCGRQIRLTSPRRLRRLPPTAS